MHRNRLTKKEILIVGVLLAMMFTTELTSSLTESQTVDEGTHLASGYSYLMKRDFRMNVEHPPLLKELAALPLILVGDGIESPFDSQSWNDFNQWQFARDFLYQDGMKADTILLLGRIPMMLLSLILGIYIFIWSRQLFGTRAGFFSLILYSLSPNFIAHARYITTDVGLTLFFVLTLYYFCKFLKEGNRRHIILTSIFLGFSIVSKFSAVILIPILLILFLIYLLSHKEKKKLQITFISIVRTSLMLFSIVVLIVMSTYLFEFKKPIDDSDVQYQFIQRDRLLASNSLNEENSLTRAVIKLTDPSTTVGSSIEWIAYNVPIPAYSYFKGLWNVYTHNYYGHTAYLMGEHSETGWWYYFPVAFLLKTPITTLILLLMLFLAGTVTIIKNGKKNLKIFKLLRAVQLEWYFLIIPASIYLLFSMNSNINLGLRHIFPIYPFLFILCGFLVTLRFKKYNVPYRTLLLILIIYYVFSSSAIFPNYLSYFNESIGGPTNGSRYLSDSNIDWGQSVKDLKQYLDERNIEYVCMSYFGQADLQYYEIDYRYLPDTKNYSSTESFDCIVAISVTSLMSKDDKYRWLRNFEPIDKVGYSIFIYDFSEQYNI